MNKEISVNILNVGIRKVECGTTLHSLSKEYYEPSARPVLLAEVDNRLTELSYPLTYDCTVEFLDITDANGYRVYQRSVSFLMICAAKTVLRRRGKPLNQQRVVIVHSVNKNYYCEFPELDEPVTDELLAEIETEMKNIVSNDIAIEKKSLPLEVALRIAESEGMYDKVELLKYRRTSSVNFYILNGFHDYFYGQMVPNTGLLTVFKLSKRSVGFLLQFPSAENEYELAEPAPNIKVSEVLEESNRWARILSVDTVGALNNKLCRDGIAEIIRTNEALHEKKIANLADLVVSQKKRAVLIAGPSSSGKTTFAARLSVQLRTSGIKPHIISLDNYYIDRDKLPMDENGKYDLETIDAIDVPQINADIAALLRGETVHLPHFNFLTGRREYKGNYLTLRAGDVIVMEGIHGLNEKVGAGVPRSETFKIFISALTQLNIDDHNRIPTSDSRLLRRIVRDMRYRAYSADRTIDMWPSVLRGEAKYIFPFQEEADAFFNSALVYEMCVLKQFAEPLLFGVTPDNPSYTEAKRLVKFLDCFLGVSSELVPPNSILREFIGGSCF